MIPFSITTKLSLPLGILRAELLPLPTPPLHGRPGARGIRLGRGESILNPDSFQILIASKSNFFLDIFSTITTVS